jgi:hypothetical protein
MDYNFINLFIKQRIVFQIKTLIIILMLYINIYYYHSKENNIEMIFMKVV